MLAKMGVSWSRLEKLLGSSATKNAPTFEVTYLQEGSAPLFRFMLLNIGILQKAAE